MFNNNNNNNNNNFLKYILVLTVKFDSLAIFSSFFQQKEREAQQKSPLIEIKSFLCILREICQIHCKIYLLKSATLHLLITVSNSN